MTVKIHNLETEMPGGFETRSELKGSPSGDMVLGMFLVHHLNGSGTCLSGQFHRALYETAIHYTDRDDEQSRAVRSKIYAEIKQCFYNCQRAVLLHPSLAHLEYCEGFAAGVIPVHHAWLIDRTTGKIIDPTWRYDDHEVCDYFGITIPRDFICKIWKQEKIAHDLAFDYLFQSGVIGRIDGQGDRKRSTKERGAIS